MKNPILKSIIRRPIRFILLILILTLTSGAFITNLTSYIFVKKEIELAKENYQSIGFIQIDMSDPTKGGNVYDLRESIKDDPMIEYENPLEIYMGVSDSILNSDYNSHTEYYNNESLGQKLFVRDIFVIVKPKNIRLAVGAENIYEGIVIESDVQELICGYPDWIYMPDGETFKEKEFKLVASKYILESTELNPDINNEIIEDLHSLEIGENYLLRCEDIIKIPESYLIKPLYDGGLFYEKIDDISQFNLDDPKWDKMKEDMELIDINSRSFNMFGVKSMETLPRFQEDNLLAEGRWMNYEDYKNKNRVCMISRELQEIRNLNIGDKIPIKYMENENPFYSGTYLTTEKDRNNWKDYYQSERLDYEIVGIYRDQFSRRDIYIPSSTVAEDYLEIYNREEEEEYIFGLNYSFVLKDPSEESNFIEKYDDIIKEKGFELKFIENNAESFWNSANESLKSLNTNMILYGILLLAIMIFVIYIYIEIYKNNYAIERILGVTHEIASKHILSPLYVFGVLGIGLSSYFGYLNGVRSSKKILSEILNELPENFDLVGNGKYIFIASLILCFFLLLISQLRLLKLKRQSILELLSQDKKKHSKKEEVSEDLDKIDLTSDSLGKSILVDDLLPDKKNKSKIFKDYGKKRVVRSIVTTGLMVAVTSLLIGSLLWLNTLIEKNKIFIDKTISETQISGNLDFIGEIVVDKKYIPEDILMKIVDTDLLEDYFVSTLDAYDELIIDRNDGEPERKNLKEWKIYEKYSDLMIVSSNKDLDSKDGIRLSGIEDKSIIDRFNSYTSQDKEVPILASQVAMDTFNLKVGDRLSFRDRGDNREIFATITGSFEGFRYPDYNKYDSSHNYIPKEDNYLFIYPMDVVRQIEKGDLKYKIVNLLFDKEKNKELYNNREEILNTISKDKYKTPTGYKLVLNDEVLVQTIKPLEKNLELLSLIYPIVLIISLLISVFLPYLIISRRNEELSIMRVLGIKEKEVRKYVFTESLLLIILGILLAVFIVIFMGYKSKIFIWKDYILVIVGYLIGSIIGIALSLRNILLKNPLDMLQVKE